MFRFRVLPFVLTAALVAGACSSDDDEGGDPGSGPSGDQLSTAEFESMVEALSLINSIGFGGIAGFDQASAHALALQTGSTTYSATENCPNGGTTGLTGTYSINTSGTQYTGNYTITQTFNNCAARSNNGTTWTFNGNPNIALTLTYTYTISQSGDAGSFSMTGGQSGGLSWSGGGKTGSCSVNTNLNYSGQVSGQSYNYTYTYTGSVCGQAVNETFTYSL